MNWTTAFHKRDFKRCKLEIKDNGSNSLEVQFGDGNITFTETTNVEYELERGSLTNAHIIEGDEVPIDVRIEAVYDYIEGRSTNLSIRDALKGVESCSSWASTDTDACNLYAVDLELSYYPCPVGCGDSEVTTFNKFRVESLEYDAREGSMVISGKAISFTNTRAAQTGDCESL